MPGMSAEPRPEARQDKTAPHTMFRALLGATGAEALPDVDRDYWSSALILDEIGTRTISEQLATGRLPAEVALLYEVPILHFRRWMRDRIAPEELDEIRSAAAESLQVKAMLTLSAHLKNPAEAAQAKALSDRFARVSEALSPNEWNPQRVRTPEDMPSITIVMNGVGPQSITTTPPIDHGAPAHHAPDYPVAPRQSRDINTEAPDLVTSETALGGGVASSPTPTPRQLPTPTTDEIVAEAGYRFHAPRLRARTGGAMSTEDP